MPTLRGLHTDFVKDRIYRETVTLITEGNGSRNEWGEWLPGVETRRSVDCMTNAISDFDEDASAGSTVSNTRKFRIANVHLYPTGFARGPDRLLYDEKAWQVIRSQRRTQPYYTSQVMAMVIEDRAPEPTTNPFDLEPNRLTLDRAMRRVVSLLSGVPREAVIPENDSAPRPQVAPYATVLEGANRYGGGEGNFYAKSETEGMLEARNRMPVAVEYQVTFYRDGARNAAATCLQHMTSEVGHTTALRTGITMGNINTDVQRQDEVVADDWEERVMFTVEALIDQRIHTQVPYFAGPPRIVVQLDEGERILGGSIDPANPKIGVASPVGRQRGRRGRYRTGDAVA